MRIILNIKLINIPNWPKECCSQYDAGLSKPNYA